MTTQIGQPVREEDNEVLPKRKIDWNQFRRQLESTLRPIPNITSAEELKAAIQQLEEDVSAAPENSSQDLPTMIRDWELPDNLIQLVRTKNRARRRAQRTLRREDKRDRESRGDHN